MRYVGETFMSTGHRSRKDWAWFLSRNVSASEFAELLAAAGSIPGDSLAAQISREPSEASVRRLLAPPPEAKPAWNAAARALIDHVFSEYESAVLRIREVLRLPPPPISEYRLAEILYAQFDDNEAVYAAVAPRNVAERLHVAWLLYAHNVVINPAYRELLFSSSAESSFATNPETIDGSC